MWQGVYNNNNNNNHNHNIIIIIIIIIIIVVVGQTSRTIEIRCQEHLRHPCHGQAEQSTVAEYLLNTRHEIQFEKTHRTGKLPTSTGW
jgi:uncharacterized protein YpmB